MNISLFSHLSFEIILLYILIYSTTHFHIVPLQTLNTSKASAHYTYPNKPDLKGQVKEVKVVYGNDPRIFFCQLTEESQNLAKLMAKLKAAYSGKWMSILFIISTVYTYF